MNQSTLQVVPANLRLLLDLIKNEVKRELNCHSIGTIDSFDATSMTANVKINYKRVLKQRNAVNQNTYTDVVIDYPLLLRCPVMVLNGGGGYTTYPIAKGDICLLLFCDRDIDIWLEQGSVQSPPDSDRMHDLSDAIALVGVFSTTKVIPAYSLTSIKTVFGRVISEFTNLLASIKDKHGERLVPVGTGPVPTFLQTPPSGWLFMYGQTLGKAGSGAVEASDDYDDLFNVLKLSYPNSSGSDFSNGDVIIIPDCRGRSPFFKNNMGGADAGVLTDTYTPNRNILGGDIGEESHQLIIAELPSHHHNLSTYKPVDQTGNIGQGDPGLGFNRQLPTLDTGSDVPHNNVSPGIIVNAMIKY